MANPGFETNGKCSTTTVSEDGDSSGGHISQEIIEMLRSAITRESRCPDVLSDLVGPESGSRGPLPDSIASTVKTAVGATIVGIAVGKAVRNLLETKPYLDMDNCFPSNLVESLTNLREKSSNPSDEDINAAAAGVDSATGDGGDREESADVAGQSLGSAAARAISDALRPVDIDQVSAAKALGRAAAEAATTEITKEIGKPAKTAGNPSDASTQGGP